jgi:hypothetical protein
MGTSTDVQGLYSQHLCNLRMGPVSWCGITQERLVMDFFQPIGPIYKLELENEAL